NWPGPSAGLVARLGPVVGGRRRGHAIVARAPGGPDLAVVVDDPVGAPRRDDDRSRRHVAQEIADGGALADVAERVLPQRLEGQRGLITTQRGLAAGAVNQLMERANAAITQVVDTSLK